VQFRLKTAPPPKTALSTQLKTADRNTHSPRNLDYTSNSEIENVTTFCQDFARLSELTGDSHFQWNSYLFTVNPQVSAPPPPPPLRVSTPPAV